MQFHLNIGRSWMHDCMGNEIKHEMLATGRYISTTMPNTGMSVIIVFQQLIEARQEFH